MSLRVCDDHDSLDNLIHLMFDTQHHRDNISDAMKRFIEQIIESRLSNEHPIVSDNAYAQQMINAHFQSINSLTIDLNQKHRLFIIRSFFDFAKYLPNMDVVETVFPNVTELTIRNWRVSAGTLKPFLLYLYSRSRDKADPFAGIHSISLHREKDSMPAEHIQILISQYEDCFRVEGYTLNYDSDEDCIVITSQPAKYATMFDQWSSVGIGFPGQALWALSNIVGAAFGDELKGVLLNRYKNILTDLENFSLKYRDEDMKDMTEDEITPRIQMKTEGYCVLEDYDDDIDVSLYDDSIYLEVIINNNNNIEGSFLIPKANARSSVFLRSKIEAEYKSVIIYDNLRVFAFRNVLRYLNYHRDNPAYEIEKPLKSTIMSENVGVCEWDANFIDAFADHELFELILAAQYLEIKPLLDLGCAKVASEIKGKKPEEIRKRFGIVNDFSPEEEEAVRAENRWAEDI
eukprot:924970_1